MMSTIPGVSAAYGNIVSIPLMVLIHCKSAGHSAPRE